ncbi:23643_t:CDS:1, partial [Gigaspora rosea]
MDQKQITQSVISKYLDVENLPLYIFKLTAKYDPLFAPKVSVRDFHNKE